MKINILTIFPEMFEGWKNTGMIAKALNRDIIEINIIDFRDYTENKHKKVDDYPFGGGEGMLLMAQPIISAIKANNLEDTHLIFPSPKGPVLKQSKLEELKNMDEITLLAGRYEGVDQRVIDNYVDEEISLGDFIITGGELAIQTILDGVIRLLPGVLNNNVSFEQDSFSDGLLEHPQYTRPASYEGMDVPEVLLNGNHKLIEQFKREEKLKATFYNRPDLLEKIELSKEDQQYLEKLRGEQ